MERSSVIKGFLLVKVFTVISKWAWLAGNDRAEKHKSSKRGADGISMFFLMYVPADSYRSCHAVAPCWRAACVSWLQTGCQRPLLSLSIIYATLSLPIFRLIWNCCRQIAKSCRKLCTFAYFKINIQNSYHWRFLVARLFEINGTLYGVFKKTTQLPSNENLFSPFTQKVQVEHLHKPWIQQVDLLAHKKTRKILIVWHGEQKGGAVRRWVIFKMV